MRGDALVALAEDGVDAIVPLERAAAAARFAFIASRKRRIIKIVTARALQKIAAHRRHVPQLRTCAGEKRFAQNRIATFD